MINETIVKKVLEKAIKWRMSKYWLLKIKEGDFEYKDIEHIVFNHDFLKILFGEGTMCEPHLKDFGNHEGDCQDIKWQYHGQQLLLEEDRLKYLKKFI